MKKVFLCIIPFIFIYNFSFGYSSEEKNQIKESIITFKGGYEEQLKLLSKFPSTTADENTFLLSIKKEILLKNLKKILSDYKTDYQNRTQVYEKYFQVLQSVDPEAGISPYYFVKLTKKIHESDIYLKALIYIFYELKKDIKEDSSYIQNYSNNISQELKKNHEPTHILDTETFQFLKKNGYNYLSKNDLERLKKYILTQKISIDAKLFGYYKKYKSFLSSFTNNKLFLQDDFYQKLQEKNLSCEINSASLFSSYILKKDISEENIFSHIPKYDTPIEKIGNQYIWGNPYQEFVGNIDGKQTKYIDKISGYGVYAKPISHAITQMGIKNKITSFDKDTIIKSLIENEPIMFWYLSKNSAGTINTTPITWKTLDNKIIQGYIGEHTGVIVGLSFFNNGEIDSVFFYEGRNKELQSFPYETLKYQTSFFNMMITKD